MTINTFTREEMEHFAATVATATCAHLVREKLLSEEVASDFVDHWTPIMLPKESVLKRLWRRLFSQEEPGKGTFLIRFVKLDLDTDSERAAGVDLKPCEQDGARSTTVRMSDGL